MEGRKIGARSLVVGVNCVKETNDVFGRRDRLHVLNLSDFSICEYARCVCVRNSFEISRIWSRFEIKFEQMQTAIEGS